MLIYTGLNFLVIAQNTTCICLFETNIPSSTWYNKIPTIIITIVGTLFCNNYGCIKQFCIKAYEKCNTLRHQMYQLLETSISTTAAIRRPVDVLSATPTPNPTPQIEGDSASEVVPHYTLSSTPPTVALPSTSCVIDMER